LVEDDYESLEVL